MTTTAWDVLLYAASVSLTAIVIGAIWLAWVSFRKPKPRRVQVPAKPGTVIELVADDGHVVGVVQLQRIERPLNGPLTVVFKDFTAFMADRRKEPRDI